MSAGTNVGWLKCWSKCHSNCGFEFELTKCVDGFEMCAVCGCGSGQVLGMEQWWLKWNPAERPTNNIIGIIIINVILVVIVTIAFITNSLKMEHWTSFTNIMRKRINWAVSTWFKPLISAFAQSIRGRYTSTSSTISRNLGCQDHWLYRCGLVKTDQLDVNVIWMYQG